MDTAADNIIKIVAILTAILSGQEEEAEQLVLECDVMSLFGALTGLLLSTFHTLAQINETTVEEYLQEIGHSAAQAL